MRRSALFLASSLASSLTVACSSLLGIEDLQPSFTDAGSAAGTDGGSAGGAGGTNNAGGFAGTGTAGTMGASGAGGAATGGTGGSAGGASGASGDAGGMGGTGGKTMDAGAEARSSEGGEVGPSAITVTGKVIDRLRHPYPGVPVSIGDKLTTTSTSGVFSIAGIVPPYDVNVVISAPYLQTWSYQGVRRADPTLQVETEVVPYKSDNAWTVLVNGASFPLPAGTIAKFAWGSPDGLLQHDLGAPGFQDSSFSWSGPTSTQGTGHVLKWTTLASGAPNAFSGYDSVAMVRQDGGTYSYMLDLSKNPAIAGGTLSGSIIPGTLGSEHTDLYVTFPGGAAIQIVNEDNGAAQSSFNYNVPKGLAGESFTLCAQAGSKFNFPYSLVHRHGLAADQTGVNLNVGDPPLLSIPAQDGTVSTATEFTWLGPDNDGNGSPDPIVYVLSMYVGDTRVGDVVTNFRVVTAATSARFPKLPPSSGVSVAGGKPGGWYVEIHGPYSSVDAATDPGGLGFLDTFDDSASIVGPNDKDGVNIWSQARGFTTAAQP